LIGASWNVSDRAMSHLDRKAVGSGVVRVVLALFGTVVVVVAINLVTRVPLAT
jgi:hypothetical protein